MPSLTATRSESASGPTASATIEAAAQQVDDIVAEHADQPHVGIFVEEIGEQRADQGLAEHIGNGDPDHALRMALLRLQGALAVAQHPHRAQAILEEDGAVLGDRNGARASEQQLRAEMLLEAREPPADRRFGQAEHLPRLGQAFGLDHLGEDEQIAHIEHRAAPPEAET